MGIYVLGNTNWQAEGSNKSPSQAPHKIPENQFAAYILVRKVFRFIVRVVWGSDWKVKWAKGLARPLAGFSSAGFFPFSLQKIP